MIIMNSEQFVTQVTEACNYLDEHRLWNQYCHWIKRRAHKIPTGEAVIKFVNMKKQEENNK